MRSDMHKIITTRGKVGGGYNSPSTYDRASTPRQKYLTPWNVWDDLRPKQESMRRRNIIYFNAKEFNDHLAPLFAFLESKVGQKWDDVWSEITSVPMPEIHREHIRNHISSMVSGVTFKNETHDPNHPYFGSFVAIHVDKKGIIRLPKKGR